MTALCDGELLRPFFDRLAAPEGKRRTVRIVQIGDSHTAGDQVTGAWRRALQARYGFAGRGMLAPGRPYAGYLTRGVTAAQSPGWTINGLFGPAYAGPGAPPLGLSGYSVTSEKAGSTLSLSADDPDQWFDRLTLCGWQRPGAGTVGLAIGAVSVTFSLDGVSSPACRTVDAAIPVSSAEVRLLSGRVTLTSWTVERRAVAGVTLSNLGTVGAQLVHLERSDARFVAAELAVAAPDLIVLAFGTNEAFKPGFSVVHYDDALQRNILRIRRLAPNVPILLLGVPDIATSRPELMTAADGTRSSCPVRPPASASVWAPPAALAAVQRVQRQRAHQLGVAYWDWAMRMGGRCVADGWARAVPPLMRGDRVHFTSAGAAEIARLLQQDLDAAAFGSPR